MKVEFSQGVPRGCIEWLWGNVGMGNVKLNHEVKLLDSPEYKWFYQREAIGDWHVPTITIKDEDDAVLFALKWSECIK